MSGGHKCYVWVKPAAIKKLARILEMLKLPTTCYQVAEALPLSRRTATAYLAHLRGEGPAGELPTRLIRIAAWVLSDTGRHMAQYQLGDAPDAPRPAARTEVQRRRDIRKRLRRDDPDELLRRRRARQMKRRKPRRDPMITAMFGAFANVSNDATA